MKRLLYIILGMMTAIMPAGAITARQAFVALETPCLNLLTGQMRSDLLTYYDADTLRRIPNALSGMSQLTRPVTDTYLKVQITPVSTMTVKILPGRRNRKGECDTIIATVYTISAPGHAADSQINFYGTDLRPLRTDKYLPLPQVSDFLTIDADKTEDREQKKDAKVLNDENHLTKKEAKVLRRKLSALIPYPTIEYILTPDSDDLTALLTVADYLGAESMQSLSPYLQPNLIYHWTSRPAYRRTNLNAVNHSHR